MAWTFYAHTDSSAPTLTGVVGSLTTLLDAVLVNGYGSKAAAGWGIAYTGTNKRGYRMGSGRLRAYIKVHDAAPVSAKEAYVTTAEGMTDVDTAVDALSVLVCRKSSTANATVRPWWCVADDRTVIFFSSYLTDLKATGFCAGEFFSYVTNDNYGVLGFGRYFGDTDNYGASVDPFGDLNPTSYSTSFQTNHYLARSADGLTKKPQFEIIGGLGGSGYNSSNASQGAFIGPLAYPNAADGGLILSPCFIRATDAATQCLRGRVRGLWFPYHTTLTGMAQGDTFSGTGDLAGKTFAYMGLIPSYSSNAGGTSYMGHLIVETSDTVARN